ncbi:MULTISPECIES: hypothetical protein [unclassified Flavobacterium]|uniref:hypothetical protein n=1 Tax=unclassified Flavobacterium TaxID=196869 RepID=UPI000968B800|nr:MULTISPECIES: hypothetical protein [unclassified Flavobacterium]MBN9285824.1 hypothetical protein [Flavobacterium sp.]OJV70295.1 MAG: hypothetical protein BGO42_10420 [Flavobacterium sp. 40-81]
MAFINSLAKGFIRSAVNQAGRDYGRSLNNRVYTDSQVTSLNLISNTTQNTDLKEEREYIYVKFIWAIILSLVLPLVGSLIVIYRGYVNYTKNYKMMYRIKEEMMYSRDRRFRNGLRPEGYRDVKVNEKVAIDEQKKAKNRYKAIGYFIIGGVIFTIYFIRFFVIK